MDLSVIVVSWNVKDLLAACLSSVFSSLSATALDYEVFVVALGWYVNAFLKRA